VNVVTAVLLFVAAAVGGAINSVAGGGSFVAFPALLFAGVPPVPANATNTIALWPGSLASVVAYRHALGAEDVRSRLVPLGAASLTGGLLGSVLLLRTSNQTFVLLIPWLLLFATLLFSFGGPVSRRLTRGSQASLGVAAVVQLVIGIYGGYFGGGMGIMVLAVLSLLGMDEIHVMNALKTMLQTLVNGVAVVAFIAAGAIAWGPGLVMIVGGIAGGYAGAAIALRVSQRYVRTLVLLVAWTMTAYFFVHTYAAQPSRVSRATLPPFDPPPAVCAGPSTLAAVTPSEGPVTVSEATRGGHSQRRPRVAISSPMASEAVAAGDGALST